MSIPRVASRLSHWYCQVEALDEAPGDGVPAVDEHEELMDWSNRPAVGFLFGIVLGDLWRNPSRQTVSSVGGMMKKARKKAMKKSGG